MFMKNWAIFTIPNISVKMLYLYYNSCPVNTTPAIEI